MATTRSGRLFWLVILPLALAGTGAGLWYAYQQGWPESAYDWAHHRLTGHGNGEGSAGHGGMPGMPGMPGINMPGMDIPGMDMGAKAEPSDVPDHAVVVLPEGLQQRLGVTVGSVEDAPLTMTVRTVGIVQADETKVSHVHLKTEGWVNQVFVGYTGQKVQKGEPLLSIYSPQFVATQQEYLNARKGEQTELARLARQRLELWDVPADEIAELDKAGKVQTYLKLRSPLGGTVLAKNVFAGQYVKPENDLYVVADLGTVWVQAKVYEYELPHVALGHPAAITLAALPGKTFHGKVVFVQPTVEEATRTVQVRVELANPDGLLRPGMFAHAVITHDMGTGLLVPDSAVIRTGEQDIAFRAEKDHRFVPVLVKVGPLRFGDRFQVLDGLKAGDRVVTSANFLIDSESRLRLGGGMKNMPGMDMGDMPGMKGVSPRDEKAKNHNHGAMKAQGHDNTKR
jgi:Cu(I)/Ag(I) efflux system membrane fusion protein